MNSGCPRGGVTRIGAQLYRRMVLVCLLIGVSLSLVPGLARGQEKGAKTGKTPGQEQKPKADKPPKKEWTPIKPGAEVDAKNAATTWVNEPPPGSLVPGQVHTTFFSKAMGREVGYCIYLPPDYQKNTKRRYPVIYSLHGSGGNELTYQLQTQVLHEGILDGRWPPMILVHPNGGRTTFYKDSADGKYPIETMIIREFIPHIDATYRTIASREGRAIQGFSMGGRGATRLAMKYPDMFCSLFNQSGNVVHVSELYDPAHPDTFPTSYLGLDRQRFIDNDSFLLLEKNLAKIKGRMRIQIMCGTEDSHHLPSVRDFHNALLKAGVDHTYIELEGLEHEHDKMVNLYRRIWFDYHVESFRRAAEAAKAAGKQE